MKKIKFIFYTILLAIIITATWTIYKNSETEGKEETMHLKQQIEEKIILGFLEYDTLNPVLTHSKEIQYLSKLIYEPLINITQDFRLEKGLSEEWSRLDERTYIIKLNKNKKWHDGTAVTANDIKFTVDSLKKLKTVYQNNVEKISNIEIIDDNTLKIYTNQEIQFLEYSLCFPILQQNSYESETLESKNAMLIGNGNYEYVRN